MALKRILSWNLFSGTATLIADVYRAKGHYIRKVSMSLGPLPLFAAPIDHAIVPSRLK